MVTVRHIALWLGMTLAAFVVALSPTHAHGRHDHGPVQASAAPTASVAGSLAVAGSQQAVLAQIEQSGHQAVCPGPGCMQPGHASHAGSCCATGLAAAGASLNAPLRVASRLARCLFRLPSGIVPEALSEPPRSFA